MWSKVVSLITKRIRSKQVSDYVGFQHLDICVNVSGKSISLSNEQLEKTAESSSAIPSGNEILSRAVQP